MSNVNIAQPDVTLLLDLDGVIREATLSRSLSDEGVEGWLGKPWNDTIIDTGGEKVRRMLTDAREQGVSAFRQVTQRFPSGLELPMEYTTVLLGGRAGLLAVGKNLQAVAELQARLIAAQQAMERDYWKMREVETRYRLLFDTSHEPVVLLRAADLRILQANPAALVALNLKAAPDSGVAQLRTGHHAGRSRRIPLDGAARTRARKGARHSDPSRQRQEAVAGPRFADVTRTQFGDDAAAFARLDGATRIVDQDSISIDDLIERLPDAFVVLDTDGVIRRANRAFLDLVEAGAKGSVVGERLTRWLWRPGADLAVLLANVERHRFIRMFTTTIQGELGTATEVEISAAGNDDTSPQYIGVLIRDVGRRIGMPGDDKNLRSALGAMAERIGKTPLRSLVKDTVGVVERHYVTSALDLANDNRTVAAELLGLSRQSLYAKLNRYGLDGGSEKADDGGK